MNAEKQDKSASAPESAGTPADASEAVPAQAAATSDGPASQPAQDLVELFNELQKRQAALDNRIKRSKAELADIEAEQQKLKKESGDVSRAADGMTGARADAAVATAEAEKVFASVKNLIDTLEDDVVKAIQHGLAAIDQEIQDATDQVSAEAKALEDLRSQKLRQESETARRQAVYDEALGRVSGLPGKITDGVGRIKKLLAELAAARDAGQAQKACVLREDAAQQNSMLKEWVGQAYEKRLLKERQDAESELSKGSGELSRLQGELIKKEALLSQRRKELKDLQDGRKSRIQQLAVQPFEDQVLPKGA
jgi:chromosome segregation ATPase